MNLLNAHIIFKLASRERPQRFRDTLDNLYSMIADKERFTIWCVLDEDDPTKEEYIGILALGNYRNLYTSWGHSKSKVHAINRPIPYEYGWDILVNWSDDMEGALYGFDVLIRTYFDEHFPDGDGLLHAIDQDARAHVPVVYIADKKYFLRDNWIYHPAYKSVWCDNHSMRLAQLRGRYALVEDVIFTHKNPAYGHLPRDPLFDRQQDQWAEDEATYKYFESINFEHQP